MQDLIRKVKETNADLGIGYDGDADRIGAVTREGRIVWGDQLLALLARDVLAACPGATIVFDVKCSQGLAGGHRRARRQADHVEDRPLAS